MHTTIRRRVAAAVAVPLIVLVSSGVLTACQVGVDCDPNIFRSEANFADQDLRGKQLQGCDLRRIGFARADLRGADLSNADLRNTDLRGTDFTGAEMNQVDLRGASIEGAIFDADLYLARGAALGGTPASLPSGWTVEDGYLVGPSANLTEASFVGVNWSGRDLSWANLTDASFTSPTFVGTNFDKANLTRTAFFSADLTGSTGPGNGTNAIGGDYYASTCSDGYLVPDTETCTGHGPGW